MSAEASVSRPDPAVAIIGMAGRFPGARDIDEFWTNLCAGVESISYFSDEELTAAGVDPTLLRQPNYVRAAPVLDDPSLFDAAFFRYAPQEARLIDPQHRLFLECAWTALEHAGYDPGRCSGPVGVYGGTAMNTYSLHSGLASQLVEEYVLTLSSSDKDFLTTRVSYKLNLTGPSITVQTACSTSLVAVHLASQSLHYGECDMALAGGVSVRVPHRVGYLYHDNGILSRDGHCRAFDAHATGTIFGSGVGIVVLKRLGDAQADGDTVHAVIRGSAVNNDGSAKVSYTAPSVNRQAAAIVEALADAGVDPATVSYVESHGTGTRLGDPIEVAALTRAFRTTTAECGFCAIGSVKTNIGHLDAAAGVAGLIKTVLALEHAQIPPTLHFAEPNRDIDFDSTPFYVPTAAVPWQTGATPRRATVNALGVGGTNAHVVVEEGPPAPKRCGPSRSRQLLPISARTEAGLVAVTSGLADHLERHPEVGLADVAYTLQVGRKAFARRRVMLCTGRDEALSGLRTLDPRRVRTGEAAPTVPDVVFLLPGQGSQYVGMGAELYRSETTFRQRVDLCADVFRKELAADLREVLFAPPAHAGQAAGRLDRTDVAQPALFTVEYALAGLWSAWGLRPQALLGHSVGELVAACLAEVFSVADAAALIAARGRLMQRLPAGSMLVVPLPEQQLRGELGPGLYLSAVNGPAQCVVAGDPAAVRELARRLGTRNVRSHPLRVNRAFHSPAMDPIVEPFHEQVRQVRLYPPTIPFVSNVTGTWIRPEEAIDPRYWARQLRQPARLADGIQLLLDGGSRVLLEVGPGHVLSGLVRVHARTPVCASLPGPTDPPSETESMLSALGGLWLAGAEVDWAGFTASERGRRVPLPTYPFERQPYWAEATDAARPAPVAAAASPPTAPAAPTAAPPLDVPLPDVDPPHPRTPVEAAIADVWQRVLGVPVLGVDDNFYQLGGHSVLVAQVVARLNATFQIDLPVFSLVESPTVAELARCVEDVFELTHRATVVDEQGGAA